jgi:hypothetical protein
VELDAQSPHDYRRGGLTLSSVNKVHHVHTIARVAEMLGEDEDWLWDVASEMDQEDGLIWVYGPDEESVMAFTDFGIETLTNRIIASRLGPAQPRAMTWNGAGAWLILSQSRQVNFSRTRWITFHCRGITSSVSLMSSPSLRSRVPPQH